MNLVSFATSRRGCSFAGWLCTLLPSKLAYRLGDTLASRVARQGHLPLVRALKSNMAVIRGLEEQDPELEASVFRLLRNASHSYIDLFRVMRAGQASVRRICDIDEPYLALLREQQAYGRGLILVGTHMCSFDILLLAMHLRFPEVQLLSNANPKGSSKVMNDLRRSVGLNITPISRRALRQAILLLRKGGMVAIGADLPVPNGEELVFFGRRCMLPTGHVRLAQLGGAGMITGASYRIGDGAYRAEIEPVPPPAGSNTMGADVIPWAQAALAQTERFIRNRPEEWLMPYPIWQGASS